MLQYDQVNKKKIILYIVHTHTHTLMRDIEKRVRCNLFDFIFIVAFFFCWRQNQLTNPHIPHPLCIRQRLRLCAPAFEYEYDPNRLRFLQQIQLQRGSSGCTNNNCHANWRHPTPWQHNCSASTFVSIFLYSPSLLFAFSSLPFPATFEVPLQMCMTTVINFCLSFVFAPPTPSLPPSLPSCPTVRCSGCVASFCLVAQTAKAKCW